MKVYIYDLLIIPMALTEKDIKNISIGVLLFLFGVAVFFLIRPVIISILGGLILAYICYPVYKRLRDYIKSPTLSAVIVSILLLVVVIIPLWFIIPFVIKQVFNIITLLQGINFQSIISSVFPAAPKEFITQISLSINSFIAKSSSVVITFLTKSFLELPTIILHLLIISFVFFFTLKDSAKLKEFMQGVSPFNKKKQGLLIKQFKDITNSVLYGNIIVGLVQGAFAGLGFFLFGIDNALALTAIATFFSMIPLVGPAIVWLPISIYLFNASTLTVAIAFLVYNLSIVATVDNVVRSYIVAKGSRISPAIVTIGIVGGIFMFGILGVVIGPLLLAYLILFIRAYREKKLYALFFEE